ncbi:MAG TPA: hypothetical protein PKL84_02535 [Candidatus Hydrogenedentes bacterium]|nr:hypothetical protein [Candidatus Hydrogenedentota bacterium]
MSYEYSGYLSTLIEAPDEEAAARVDRIVFTAKDLSQWSLTDRPTEKEWQQTPVQCERGDDFIRLEGRFDAVRRIDNLGPEDPSFWVALSSRNWRDNRFPVDVLRYPIAEITYRCLTEHARPAWLWQYPGGEHVDGLRNSTEWRTIARLIPHYGFPSHVDSMTIRLFSTSRSTEIMEIQSIVFRALTPEEDENCRANDTRLESYRTMRRYPVLDTFMPYGACLKAGTAKRMAERLEVSLRDYWRLAMEDMVRHYHNCIAIEEPDQFSAQEWRELLALAESFHIKVLAQFDWPLEEIAEKGRGWIDTHVRPYANSPALLAWSICDEPPEHTFQAHLDALALFEEADPNHPLTATMRNADSFPLFAPFLPATGISHFKSRSAWEMSDLVRTHLPLSGGQHVWVVAPAFVYATDTPEWYTCPEIRLMLNLALAHGARGWFAFSYHNDPIWINGPCQRSLTGPFLTFSDIWDELGLRVERIGALSPLLLQASPCEEGNVECHVTWESGLRAMRPKEVEPLTRTILRGPDYCLFYLVSNDIVDVSPTNIYFEERHGLELYDVTDFTRERTWEPMPRRRHAEMLPGQGRVILCAAPEVCERLRVEMAQRMIEDDSRQIAVDLGLARRYDLPVAPVQRLMQDVGMGDPLKDVRRTRTARDQLTNILYAAPHVTGPRGRLIQISAAICGCDGALCRLLARGRAEKAHEFGLKVISVARELTHLRLRLREGEGRDIDQYCSDLSRRTLKLLAEIRALD